MSDFDRMISEIIGAVQALGHTQKCRDFVGDKLCKVYAMRRKPSEVAPVQVNLGALTVYRLESTIQKDGTPSDV
jgi:hypothetical protein